ncbi:MAG TPA: hypothetical protein VF041_13565 [Gemmatimonadaceae bacterium]
MLRNVLVVGGACAVLAGCADAPRGVTGPSDAALRLSASGTVSVRVPARGTVAFPASVRADGPRGVSLSRVGPPGEGERGSNGGRAVLPLIAVRDGARGLLGRRGEYRRVLTMRDESGRVHHLVALYDGSGGPPRAIQHYVGRTLVRVTAMEWEHVRGGWAERRLVARELRHGALALEVDARAATLHVASSTAGGSPFARVRAGLLAALAYTFAPSAAQAQYYFSECWTQYKNYWKATAALTAAILAIEVAVESEVGDAALNALYFSYTSALALAVAAEMELYLCVDNAREADRDGSSGSTSSTSDGGSSGGTEPSDDCLEGSYAARCQTQFGL